MSKKQVVVRTYPNGWMKQTKSLQDYLSQGYCVVMCNKFHVSNEVLGNEYILEKEE